MLLGGKSLHAVLKENIDLGLSGIPADDLISYMQDSAKGLDFLNQPQHDLGEGLVAIQHCDVKPANIVTIGNSAVICDFGLARILSRHQATGTSVAGTPAYMAPEAINGKPGTNSDQYSLAITYYQLRTGRLPADGKSIWEIMDKHRSGRLNFDAVSPAERDVLQVATKVDHGSRYPSCVAMVDAMRDAVRNPTRGNVHKQVVSNAVVETLGSSASRDMSAAFQETTDDLSKVTHNDDPTIQSSRRPLIIGGAVTLAAVVAISAVVVGMRENPTKVATTSGVLQETDEPRDVPGRIEVLEPIDPRSSMESAIAKFPEDESVAIEQFADAISQQPDLAEPETVRLSGTAGVTTGAIEGMWIAGSSESERNWLVTLGVNPSPILYRLPATGEDLQTLANKDASRLVLARDNGPPLRQAVSVSPSGDHLLVGGEPPVQMWAMPAASSDTSATPINLESPDGESLAVAWHPTRPIAVSGHDSGEFAVWEFDAGTVKRHEEFSTPWTAKTLASDPSGEWLLAVTENDEVMAQPWNAIIETLDVKQAPKSHSIKSEGTKARVIAFATIDSKPCVVVGDAKGPSVCGHSNQMLN